MIVLATPTRDTVTAGFTADLVKLIRRHAATDDITLHWAALIGIYIANLRQYGVTLAQGMGASHILFVDSDMRFPADTLDRLVAADKDIVAANYVQRTAPQWWTSRFDGEWISSVGRTGLQEVEAVGFGVILIRLSVFDALARPWFDTPYDGQNHVGEDLYFCQQARNAGFSVWIDHDLSQQVRHQGTVELGVHCGVDLPSATAIVDTETRNGVLAGEAIRRVGDRAGHGAAVYAETDDTLM